MHRRWAAVSKRRRWAAVSKRRRWAAVSKRRRWAAVAAALMLATACGGGGDSGPEDPLAEAPAAGPGAGGSGGAATALYQPFTALGTVSEVVDESSGLAASRRSPGLLWTHNDSGDEPFVYCLDLQARSCGVWRVAGAEALDWEDMAAGPGPRSGEQYLYLGDIGDNLGTRGEIVVYRIPEPATGGGAGTTKASPGTSAPAEALRLKYPDGARDAEALAVHPVTGDVYVVSKDAQSAKVYKAAAPLDASRVTTMTQVGTIRLGTGTRGLELITGADIAPDGRRVAVVTYAQGYELELPAGKDVFDDIWSERPVPVTLGPRLQGESVAYRLDGRALLTTSEILPWQLQQVERRSG